VRASWVAALAVPISILSSLPCSRRAIADGLPPEPQLEGSGFVGLSLFGDTELGNSWAHDQAPQTSPVLGARVGYTAWPDLVQRGWLALSLAIEAELSLATAFTGGSPARDDGRMAYFSPVFGWRAHVRLRQPIGANRRFALHAVLGAGGATIASSSPFMAKETDPLAYGGLGTTYALSRRWQLRLDVRQGIMPGRATSVTRISELQLGLITTFGVKVRRPPPAPPPPEPPQIAIDATDTDADGLPDRLDRCPAERETVNGISDEDGCPEPDLDADGVLGAADACPNEPEDIDRFKDEDGCPDPDNDGDQIEDARDACPNERETKNGYTDTDGCPDTVPEGVAIGFANVGAVSFESGRARVTPEAKRVLQQVLALLEDEPEIAIAIIGTPERAGGEDLAKRRAEAVKWYLVDQGIAEDRIDTLVGPATGPSPIVMKLR
jgi:outer membrane protein OmpA-like peptidoglycan-associated protein